MAARTRVITALLVLMALVAASCGDGASDELAENILEQQPGVEDVAIDTDDDSMTISIESDDGDISLEMGSGDLPDGFPFPIPDGCDVVGSSSWEGPDGTAMQAGLEFPAEDFDSVVAFYEDFLDDEGFEITKTTSGSGSDAMVMLLAENVEASASVIVSQTDVGCTANLTWTTETG